MMSSMQKLSIFVALVAVYAAVLYVIIPYVDALFVQAEESKQQRTNTNVCAVLAGRGVVSLRELEPKHFVMVFAAGNSAEIYYDKTDEFDDALLALMRAAKACENNS